MYFGGKCPLRKGFPVPDNPDSDPMESFTGLGDTLDSQGVAMDFPPVGEVGRVFINFT